MEQLVYVDFRPVGVVILLQFLPGRLFAQFWLGFHYRATLGFDNLAKKFKRTAITTPLAALCQQAQIVYLICCTEMYICIVGFAHAPARHLSAEPMTGKTSQVTRGQKCQFFKSFEFYRKYFISVDLEIYCRFVSMKVS